MATPWGPLQPLLALLEQKEADLDHRAQDAALVRALTQEDLSAAVRMASLEQLDAVLAYPTLGADRKPTALLLLLYVRVSKIEKRPEHSTYQLSVCVCARCIVPRRPPRWRCCSSAACRTRPRRSTWPRPPSWSTRPASSSTACLCPLRRRT